jgi:NADH dehydrogenase FAD-containing subunit
MKHVVIVHGGFAGLNCAGRLANHSDLRVTLIDKNNYHQFQQLLSSGYWIVIAEQHCVLPARDSSRS